MSNRIRTLVVSLVILALALPAGAQGLNAGRGFGGESALGWLWHSLVNPLVAVFAPGSTPTTIPPPTAGDPDSPKDTLVVNRYLFWKDGKLLLLSMSSVKGVDNNDAWNLMANSFKWN